MVTKLKIKLKNKIDSVSAPAKASFWFTICSIVNKCIQFITVPIFTRMLSTAEYGQYSVFISWQSIIIIIATMNLYSNVFNNGLLKYNDNRKSFLSSLQGLTTTITIALMIVFWLFQKIIVSFIGLPIFIIELLLIEVLLMPGFEFWAADQRFDYKYKKTISVTLMVATLNPLLGLLFVYISSEKGYARIISVLTAEIVVYIVLYIYNFIKGKLFFDIKYWKYALCLGVPLIPHYISQVLLNQMDRIMISSIIGTAQAGIYSVAYSAAFVLQFVGKAIQNSFTPWIYKKIKANEVDDIKPTVNVLVVLVAGINLLLICFAPEVIFILGGRKYSDAIHIVPPVAASTYLIFIYSMFCVIEFYYEKTKAMTIVSVSGALINYITNYIFIRMFGYFAAGYTTLFSYLYFTVIHYFVMRKALRSNGYKDNIYDMKFIGILSVVFIIFSILINFVYTYIVVRYSILFVIFMIMLIKRNIIKRILSKSK